MSDPASVSTWLGRLPGGNRDAIEALWKRYFHQLVRLARDRLGDVPRAAADEEDVALSAFDSFFRGAEQGRFPRLANRKDLWAILFTITIAKVCDLVEHEKRICRDWRRNLPPGDGGYADDPVFRLLSRDPDPAHAAAVADRFEYLLDLLPDDECRFIALRKLEGFTSQEIAVQLGLALATVERRLALIRMTWQAECEKDEKE